MIRINEEEKEKLLDFVRYFITSFADDDMTNREKEIILKVLLYRKKSEDVKKMIDSVDRKNNETKV